MVTVHTRTGDPVINPAAPTDCDQSALCHNPNLATAVGDLVPGADGRDRRPLPPGRPHPHR